MQPWGLGGLAFDCLRTLNPKPWCPWELGFGAWKVCLKSAVLRAAAWDVTGPSNLVRLYGRRLYATNHVQTSHAEGAGLSDD